MKNRPCAFVSAQLSRILFVVVTLLPMFSLAQENGQPLPTPPSKPVPKPAPRPLPGQVGMTYEGDGCPKGTVTIGVDEATSTAFISMDAMNVIVADATAIEKTCRIDISFNPLPNGLKLVMIDPDIYGEVSFGKNVSMQATTTFYLPIPNPPIEITKSIGTPTVGRWDEGVMGKFNLTDCSKPSQVTVISKLSLGAFVTTLGAASMNISFNVRTDPCP